MKKIIAIFLCVLVFVLTSCSFEIVKNKEKESNTQVSGDQVYIKDFAGKEYTITKAPEKICSISLVATEIIYDLGEKRKVAVLDEESLKIESAPLNIVTVTADEFLPQMLAEMKIDAFFYEEKLPEEILEKLDSFGINAYMVQKEGNIAVAELNVRFVASILFKRSYGETVIKEMREDIELVKILSQNLLERKKVYVEGGNPDNIFAYGNDTLIGELVQIAGGDNIFASQIGTYKATDDEVVQKEPDVIISFVSGEDFSVSNITERKGYTETNAYMRGWIYIFDPSISLRPTPSVTDALYEMAYLLDTMTRE